MRDIKRAKELAPSSYACGDGGGLLVAYGRLQSDFAHRVFVASLPLASAQPRSGSPNEGYTLVPMGEEVLDGGLCPIPVVAYNRIAGRAFKRVIYQYDRQTALDSR